MTVMKIGRNKFRVTLSDSEVTAYFGAYETIALMTEGMKIKIGALLEESLAGYGVISGNNKLMIELSAQRPLGCNIFITIINKIPAVRHRKPKKYLLEFSDSESMTAGILWLYRNRKYRRLESSLYKMSGSYRLIITAPSADGLLAMGEFCIRRSDSALETAYTEEYGKPLIEKNAVPEFGKAFFTDS